MSWDIRHLFSRDPQKSGFLVELDEGVWKGHYVVHTHDGSPIRIEYSDHEAYIINRMKKVGVPIIPLARFIDPKLNKEGLEKLRLEFSTKSKKGEF